MPGIRTGQGLIHIFHNFHAIYRETPALTSRCIYDGKVRPDNVRFGINRNTFHSAPPGCETICTSLCGKGMFIPDSLNRFQIAR